MAAITYQQISPDDVPLCDAHRLASRPDSVAWRVQITDEPNTCYVAAVPQAFGTWKLMVSAGGDSVTLWSPPGDAIRALGCALDWLVGQRSPR